MSDRTYIQHGRRHAAGGSDPIPVPISQTFAARIYSVAIQTFSNNTNSDFTYDTIDTDTAEMVDLGADNRILTAVVSGFYQVSAEVVWASNATGRRIILIFKNGYYSASSGTLVGGQSYNAITDAGATTPTTVSTLVHLDEGDFVSVGVYQKSGGSLSSTAGVLNQPYQNYLAAVLVGA